MWFNNRKDDGVRFPNIYKPFPKVTLALILTMVSLPSPEPMFLWNANHDSETIFRSKTVSMSGLMIPIITSHLYRMHIKMYSMSI